MIKHLCACMGAAVGCAVFIAPAGAAIVVTEVHPTGSSGPVGADWIELTNTGSTSVDITNWRIDDSSSDFGLSVALRNVTSIPAGGSVVFFETNSSGSNEAALQASFISSWFGSSAPSGFIIGAYGGSGIGLSSGGDGVVIFDAGGSIVASVNFGAATTAITFDNSVGATGTISTLSSNGVNGAWVSAGNEVGSPGVIPTPGALGLLGLGVLAAGRRGRKSRVAVGA